MMVKQESNIKPVSLKALEDVGETDVGPGKVADVNYDPVAIAPGTDLIQAWF